MVLMELKEEMVDRLLAELARLLRENSSLGLKELSNRAIEQVMTTEDPRLVNISLVSYGLYKVLGKPHLAENKKWIAIRGKMLRDIEDAIRKERTLEELGELLKDIVSDVSKFDALEGRFVEDVIDKARLKQASRLYALGMSLSKAASLTGTNTTDLFGYVGSTKIHESTDTKTLGIKERYAALKRALAEGEKR